MKQAKIVMMSMFRNEAHTIGRMLESCYKYIDYYVLQDNGSTDGTPEVVENFFKDKNIPGFVYKVEEGWVNFGWNRDHLLQTVLKTDHGCDWILKMDCDETLYVDEQFDWSLLDDKTIQSFHITAHSGGTCYFRAWMWNARLPWRFNHDTAHETISLEIDGIGENFQRVNLPSTFKHVTYNDGQSYGVRTKYLTDALLLEEKLIRQDTLLTDLYHFWYIGKSYNDCYANDFYPLKNNHCKELARRCIFYFKEYVNFVHDYDNTGRANGIDEMSYFAMMLIGNAYKFLEEYSEAEKYYKAADDFCPRRNEHWVRLAEMLSELKRFDEMYEITSLKLINPERTNPFPDLIFLIELSAYHNESDYVHYLHNIAIENKSKATLVGPAEKENIFNFKVNNTMKKRLFVVDNFYENPDEIRKFALSAEFEEDLRFYKGKRSKQAYRPDGVKEAFEAILGEPIKIWNEHQYNGCFQITTAQDPQVYHHDLQKWAAIVYLSPDAPLESGTRLHQSKLTGARHADDPEINGAFAGGFYDSTKFDVVDNAGNVYNRLIIMDARCIHSAGSYFGTDSSSGRLIHLFFFD